MKKILSFALWVLMAWILSYGLVSADGLTRENVIGLFDSSNSLFWYSSDQKLSVDDITTTSITFSSPVLVDDLWARITDYILLYWNHSFDELLADPALLSWFTEVSFSPQGNENTLTMTLNSNLNANTIYYVVAIPRDDWEMLWSASNQICFKLKDKIYWESDECANWTATTSTTHTSNSWASAIALANVSCTWDGKKVTISWVPTSNIWDIKISLYNESTNNFDIKGTVNANNEKTFSFNVNQSTAPIVRFDDTDGLSAYKTYTCHKLSTSTPEPTTPTKNTGKVPTVPTVWPKENILAIIAWALVLYVFYRVVRRKAD